MKIEIPLAHLPIMEFMFHLSGEDKTLPRSEVLNLLKHRQMEYQIIEDMDQILVCNVKKSGISSFEVLAMTHAVFEYIGSCDPYMDKINSIASGIDPIQGSFSVRAKRIKRFSKHLSTLDIERSIGEVVEGKKVDLKNPETRINGFLTSDSFVLGKRLFEIKRSDIEKRNPQFRPFFHPSSLSPILSKTLCNICGVKKDKKVFDPFCGTGGILIEAGLLGSKVYGMDIDERMVQGCRKNLSHFGIEGVVEQGDATEINQDGTFDIIITDPPYGRSSTTKGRKLGELYKSSLESIARALKADGVACVISPDSIDVTNEVTEGLKVVETHNIPVHKSLTRKITIMKKN